MPPSRPTTPRSSSRGSPRSSAADARRRPRPPQPRLSVQRVTPAPKSTEATGQRSGRRSGLTGRAAILAVVVCVLAVSLAYPLRQYVDQRSRTAELQQRIEESSRQVEELRVQKQRWEDPAYVEQQARERLFYVQPGETGYVVVGEPPASTEAEMGDAASVEDRPWYDTLWRSVDAAAKVGG